MGLTQKGRSRTWVDDHGWWVIVVEFQPLGYSVGSYLNVGACWLWQPRSEDASLHFDEGHRVQHSFTAFESEQQFLAAATGLAETASQEVLALRERFDSPGAAVSLLPMTLAGIGTPSASGTTVVQMLPVGTYTVHAVAIDGAGKSVTTDLPLVITATAPAPPVVVSPGDQNSLLNAAVSVKATAADPDGGPVTFSATGLPAGLGIDPATGVISGAATVSGTFAVTITATDDETTFTNVALNWTVSAACVAVAQPAGGVLVDWAPIAGVTTYTVRVNGGWLADVTGGATDYLHAAGTTANAYQVRYRLAGLTTIVDCPF